MAESASNDKKLSLAAPGSSKAVNMNMKLGTSKEGQRSTQPKKLSQQQKKKIQKEVESTSLISTAGPKQSTLQDMLGQIKHNASKN